VEQSTAILYEHPFNEGIRTMLRLEHLFDRLRTLVPRDDALDHHFALVTLFEMTDVAARADLKAELLKELERQRGLLQAYRGHPGISQAALDDIVARIEQTFQELNALQGKLGHALNGNEWLMSIRSRIGIPGGTCSFDLPGYHAWQQHEPARRRSELIGWIEPMRPLAEALQVLLGLLRDSAVPQRMHAAGGQYQQRLPEGRTYQLLRLRMDGASGLVPEITGHRLLVSVRMMRSDAEGRLKPATDDTDFELTLCG
jgi:cell division protein ZapD